jgi:hypothetical protein
LCFNGALIRIIFSIWFQLYFRSPLMCWDLRLLWCWDSCQPVSLSVLLSVFHLARRRKS